MLIHNKDDIEFVAEFPCLLGHPVVDCVGGTTACRLVYKDINEFNRRIFK